MHGRVLVTLTLLLAPALAGCLNDTSWMGDRGSETRLILMDDRLFVNGTGDGGIEGRFGGHCGKVHVETDPPHVTLTQFWDGTRVPRMMLVRTYAIEHAPDAPHVFSVGQTARLYEFHGDADGTLDSPLEGGPALANYSVDGDAFRLNGNEMTEDARWNDTFHYAITPHDGGSANVTEHVTLRHLGTVPVTVVGGNSMCD